jgi:hypothetical protein
MKTAPIEKFQYLVHLKATNPHLFYRLLGENIKVCNHITNILERLANTITGIDAPHLHPHRR